MKIGVNGRFLAARPTGVQRFAAEVVSRLCERADVSLFVPRGVEAPDWPARVVTGRATGVVWEQQELTRAASACDVLLHPANAGAVTRMPYVCVIHDVLPLTNPRWFSPAFAAWYRLQLPRLARNAARVITPSEWSRRELCRVLRVAPGRVRVAPQGLAPFDAPASPVAIAVVRARYRLPREYLLFVGGGDPRKRLHFMTDVLDAWAATGETPPPLVVVGGHSRHVHGTGARAHSQHEVRAIGHCDDVTLHALYTGAAALCFPSAAEGFGRPPLEALACGTPVVATPFACAAETIAGLAHLEPLDPVHWAWRLRRIVAAQERVNFDLTKWNWDRAAGVIAAACEDAARTRTRVATRPAERRFDAAPAARATMRVALVHDWLTGMRGGERVLEALLDLYPHADLFTLVHVPHSVSRTIESRLVHASYVNRLPLAHRHYRYYLPLFPHAVESLDLAGYDVVISSSHCVAKGVITRGAPHLCYCHTPMRYAWDMQHEYGRAAATWPARAVLRRVRVWDYATAGRPDRILANSQHVRARIRRYWRRDANVVHPPVAVESFTPAARKDDYCIAAGALVPYKRVDLAIEAFNRLGRHLVVTGDGPEYARLRRLAGRCIEFTGHVSDAEMSDLLARARALVMPMVEDFGIVAVEAQAAGTPVIALGRGGALESVVDITTHKDGTGLYFHEQTAEALAAAVQDADGYEFSTQALRANALRFTRARFHENIRVAVQQLTHAPSLLESAAAGD